MGRHLAAYSTNFLFHNMFYNSFLLNNNNFRSDFFFLNNSASIKNLYKKYKFFLIYILYFNYVFYDLKKTKTIFFKNNFITLFNFYMLSDLKNFYSVFYIIFFLKKKKNILILDYDDKKISIFSNQQASLLVSNTFFSFFFNILLKNKHFKFEFISKFNFFFLVVTYSCRNNILLQAKFTNYFMSFNFFNFFSKFIFISLLYIIKK